MKEKVVLAYSGGLDTTAIIPWLKENYGYDVICCCINCGQGEELDGLEERAKLSGASKLYIEDIVDEFCDDYIMPCVQAGAIYENKYLLGDSGTIISNLFKSIDLASKYGVQSIPNMIFFKEGKAVTQIIGFANKDAILDKINPFMD